MGKTQKAKNETIEAQVEWPEAPVLHLWDEPFCAAVCVIRGFKQRGEMLRNPSYGFDRELIASSAEDRYPRDSTRMSRILRDRANYNDEKDASQQLSDEIWVDRLYLTPEEALVRLARAEGLFPSWEKRIYQEPLAPYEQENLKESLGYLERFGSPTMKPARFSRKPDPDAKRAWRRKPTVKNGLYHAFVKAERWMHDCELPPYMIERMSPMNSIDRSALIVERTVADYFEGVNAIPNPLIALRQHDDAGNVFFAGEAARELALPVLEDLSRRVWHHRASVGIYSLMSFLMLQPDGGLSDLALIESYAELLGGTHRETADAAHPEPTQLSFDSEFGLE